MYLFWNSIQFAPILWCFAFSFGFIFIWMDQIASTVLTVPIGKNMIFTFYLFILVHLRLYYIFQAPLSLWDFVQLSSTCLCHLKIGTCSLNIMLNNNFNFHNSETSSFLIILLLWVNFWFHGKRKKINCFSTSNIMIL
jgi:hypothetical protein